VVGFAPAAVDCAPLGLSVLLAEPAERHSMSTVTARDSAKNGKAKPRWQRALVTGASSGIGEAFARRLAAEGSDVVVVARRGDRLNRLADELGSNHAVSVDVCVADLAVPEQLRHVEHWLVNDAAPPVDLLVNNAGGHRHIAKFWELDRDALSAEAAVNGFATLRLMHAALTGMSKRRRGNIINISAGVAFYPAPGSATYAASKAFVNSLGETVNFELRGTGVHVTTVCPGYTRTESPTRLGFHEGNVPRMLWMDPKDLVEQALKAAARGTSIYTPRLLNRFGTQVGHHLPRWIVLRWVEHFFNPNR
jgi:uncharacterized protein